MGHIFFYIHMYNNFWLPPGHFELFIVENLESLKNTKFFSIRKVTWTQTPNYSSSVMGSSRNLCSILWALAMCWYPPCSHVVQGQLESWACCKQSLGLPFSGFLLFWISFPSFYGCPELNPLFLQVSKTLGFLFKLYLLWGKNLEKWEFFYVGAILFFLV